MLTPGQTLSLTIEKPAVGGRMIARAEGQVVLVSGAIPGERVITLVERVGRGVAYADVTAVEDGSPDRRAVTADPLCGGCLYSHIAYARQLDIKSLVLADAFSRIARLPLEHPVSVTASPEEGYRMRARLHVRSGRVGFFREATHDVCDARQTRQLRTDTCDILERLAGALGALAGPEIREMEVSESVDASQRAVHVEASHPLDARIVARMPAPSGVTGLTVTVRDVRGAAVESVVFGSPFVEDVVRVRDGEIRLRRHVMSFFQGNRFLLPALVDEVIAHVRHGDRVLDLYAGTGLFSIAAAALRGAVATAVEGGRTSAADLRANASAVGAGVVTTVHLPVEAFVGQSSERFDVAVVDPPRTGISREALQGVMRLRPGTVVYVSCDVATLARDVRRLVDGGYRLVRLVGFDLFPNTPHVEAVGVLTIG